jgi:hypothetical protein
MHLLADFDNQTKLLHVGYSVLGVLVSMLVLVKFKPSIMPRMVTALILGFILVYCLSTPLTGDQERLKDIYSIGWFCLGLLFGIGRGEFVIEYLNRKFFGAPDQLADQFAKSEALRQSSEGGESNGGSDGQAVAVQAGPEPDTQLSLKIASEEKIEVETQPNPKSGDAKD